MTSPGIRPAVDFNSTVTAGALAAEEDVVRFDEMDVNAGPGRRVVATFDEHELTVVLFEAWIGAKRPPGASVRQTLDDIEQRLPIPMVDSLKRQSRAALEYVVAQLQGAKPEQLQ